MKPSEASAFLNIAATTIRLWSNQFGEYLSPTGAGGGGRQRDFTEHDIKVLRVVREMKRAGNSADDIVRELARLQANDWIGLPPMPESPANVASVPVVPAAAADMALDEQRRALLREIATLQERLERVEGLLTDEQAARRADVERLMRENSQGRDELLSQMGELRGQLAAALNELELWRKGRLKPE